MYLKIKAILVCTFLYFSFFLFSSEVSIIDEFSSGKFPDKIAWFGDTSMFSVTADSTLQLCGNVDSSKAVILTSSEVSNNAEWKLDIHMDFNPSSTNLAKFHLMLDDNNCGYYLLIGGTNDQVILFRRDKDGNTPIIESPEDFLYKQNVDISVKINREGYDKWQLEVDTTPLVDSFELIGSCIDSIYKESNYSGIECNYSKTRANLFWFDNFFIEGSVFVDSFPPFVVENIFEGDSLFIFFNEDIEGDSLFLNGQLVAFKIFENQLSLPLTFLQRGDNSIVFKDFGDLNSIKLSDSSLIVSYNYAEYMDILINEVMADPSPAVGLPEYEYLELFNNSEFDIDLGRLILDVNGDYYLLPSYNLQKDSFLLITKVGALEEFQLNNGIELFSSVYSIANNGGYLRVLNTDSSVISILKYNVENHQSSYFANGGWSLELGAKQSACNSEYLETSVSSLGGTPGKPNSINYDNLDNTPPLVKNFLVSNDSLITIEFNEQLNPNLIPEFNVNGLLSVQTFDSILYDKVFLRVDENFSKSAVFKLEVLSAGADCYNNNINFSPVEFGFPEEVSQGDIVINEVLFNPYTGSCDFVEFYNNSDKYISVSSLNLANKSQDAWDDVYIISEKPFLFPPKEFLVATPDTEELSLYYSIGEDFIFIQTSVPTMPDDEGNIYLCDKSMSVIDNFSYSEDMHSPFLVDNEGVSLERVNYNLPTNSTSTWMSASTLNNATPGFINSQFSDNTNSTSIFEIYPGIISPDNDGVDDFLNINLNYGSGEIIKVEVFNSAGVLVKIISNNDLGGAINHFKWDGSNSKGEKVLSGIYLIQVTVSDEQNNIERDRGVVVVY